MLRDALNLLCVCVCVCSDAGATHLRYQTKAILKPRIEEHAHEHAHGPRWGAESWADGGPDRRAPGLGTGRSGLPQFWTTRIPGGGPTRNGTRPGSGTLTRSRPGSGAVLRRQRHQADGPEIRGVFPGKGSEPDRDGTGSRSRRSAPTQRRAWAPGARTGQGASLPEAMAQGQEFGSPNLSNASVDEDVHMDDYPTQLPPGNTRTRTRAVLNLFYPVRAESYGASALVVLAAALFGAGMVGNLALMCAVTHNFYLRSVSNSLLANMALWDFCVLLVCLPLVVLQQLTNIWLLGAWSCKVVPYLEAASLGVTTFTLCALCIDRFRAATNVTMYYEMMENCASTSAKLAVIWAGALLLALPELLIRQLVTEDGAATGAPPSQRCVVRVSTQLPDTLYVLGLTYDGARLWWYFGCYFCLPTLFTICSSLVTVRKIRRAERACLRGSREHLRLESQMNCVVVALAVVYGFCVIPENVCNVVGTYMAAGIPRKTLDILHLVGQLLLFCKSAATPALLFWLCRPFTRTFLDCCCCCCDACGPAGAAGARRPSDADRLELEPLGTVCREPPGTASFSPGTRC